MHKSELSSRVASLAKATADSVVDAVFSTIADTLATGESVAADNSARSTDKAPADPPQRAEFAYGSQTQWRAGCSSPVRLWPRRHHLTVILGANLPMASVRTNRGRILRVTSVRCVTS